ncbi:MAG TPA: hypothetical protein P5052_01320 [Candidatus Paceibacterota bacterium]|jgi:hypothetical protein|nr:hypothetical protein [Candidatus Paceibacterota bacterium]HRZ29409.1 hypothetical protein [Candidatus Paceibacterota bacterium]
MEEELKWTKPLTFKDGAIYYIKNSTGINNSTSQLSPEMQKIIMDIAIDLDAKPSSTALVCEIEELIEKLPKSQQDYYKVRFIALLVKTIFAFQKG